MFTGIIKSLGKIEKIVKEGTNIHFTVTADMSKELNIDESVSHNGTCLTVVERDNTRYVVTAIEETLIKTNLGNLKEGDSVNLERAMISGGRLDGHIVQGHVDTTGTCVKVEEKEGSWHFSFKYKPTMDLMLVDKGSICLNGVSLTVIDPIEDIFSVAIIPFTYEHTTFKNLKPGDAVNLEFDVLGKYIAKYMQAYMPTLVGK
ncbi:MAG: riboflavin synthase [Maribacter sp.]|jgi:riboflavin synthase